jgi:hypothetical protein
MRYEIWDMRQGAKATKFREAEYEEEA